jgi:hypothetical protein
MGALALASALGACAAPEVSSKSAYSMVSLPLAR